jgi:hypothetical protein
MKSKNHEICQYLTTSYKDVVVKFEWVSHIFLRMMLRNWNISEEVS